MDFKLDKIFINEVKSYVTEGNEEAIKKMLTELHPADVAEILDIVNLEEAKFVYRRLEDEKASEVLVELEEDVREMFLKALSAKEIAEQIDNMDSDDAADIIAELPIEKQESVISQIEDKEQAEEIASLMLYDEDTAGAWMGTELIAVKENWTAKQCISEMRKQAEEVSYVYTIYVVNDTDKLIGMFSMKSLLFASDNTVIKDFSMPNVKSVGVEDNIEEVASLMQKYDLVTIPVIDDEDTLVGRITIDDIMDVIKDESEKDYQMASGISEKIESSDSIWMISRARLPWLLVGLLGGVLGAKVIGLFDHQLDVFPQMALFIPLIAAMGGNVGVQSSAIIVQSLANNTLDLGTTSTKLFKELGVALLNGVACSIIIFFVIWGLEQELKLASTVSISLILVIVFAGLFGTIVPLVLNSRKIDPALATGPFITTMNDVVGLLIYFLIGWAIYF
jgi:magnesium transporter